MLEALHELGYDTYRLEPAGLRPLDDAGAIDTYCNLMCLPKS
jgi:hypothetical protein